MPQCLLFCSVDVEFKIFIPNSFENWDPDVHSKYRTISERYQKAEKYIFQISDLTLTISIQYYKFQVVFHHNINAQTHSAKSTTGQMSSE